MFGETEVESETMEAEDGEDDGRGDMECDGTGEDGIIKCNEKSFDNESGLFGHEWQLLRLTRKAWATVVFQRMIGNVSNRAKKVDDDNCAGFVRMMTQ